MTVETSTTAPDLLRAVNILLNSIGVDSVLSLSTANMDKRAAQAIAAINEASWAIQMKGWHFNTEEEFPLAPDSEGFITLPTNTAAFKLADRSADRDIAERGLKLYDKEKFTAIFTAPVYANLTLIFEFSEVPLPIRNYILMSAGYDYSAGRKPESLQARFTKEKLQAAISEAEQYDEECRNKLAPELSGHFASMGRR